MNKLFTGFVVLPLLVHPALAETAKETIAADAGKCQAVFEEMTRIHSVAAADIMFLGTAMGFDQEGVAKIAYRFAALADNHTRNVAAVTDTFNAVVANEKQDALDALARTRDRSHTVTASGLADLFNEKALDTTGLLAFLNTLAGITLDCDELFSIHAEDGGGHNP